MFLPLGLPGSGGNVAKPSCSSISTSLFFSKTMFSPSIPISATCCSTYWGISSSLRKRTSTGKFDAVF